MKEVIIKGTPKCLINEKDQIKYIIYMGLHDRGWKPVSNEISGVYVKNNFTLFVYADSSPKAYVTYSDTLPGAMRFFNVPRASWHLEKAGTLIDSGRLKLDMSYVFETDYFEDTDYQNFLNLVDSYTSMSPFELKNFQKMYLPELIEKPTVCDSNKQIIETMFFKVKNSTDQLHAGNIYQINEIDSEDKVIYVINIYDGNDLKVLTFTELAVGIKSENFSAIELKTMKTQSDTFSLVSLASAKTSSLPPQLNDMGFSDEQLGMISEAIAKKVNILPLLRRELGINELKELITLCTISSELNYLLKIPNDVKSIQLFVEVVKQGFSLYTYLENYSNSESLQLQLQDDINSHEELVQELRSEYRIDAIEQQKYISSSYFKIFALHPDYTKFHVKIEWFRSQLILSNLCNDFINKGMVLDKMLYIAFPNVTTDSKAELRSYFFDKDLFIDNKSFTEVYDGLLKRVNYVAFNQFYDFLISTPEGFIAHLDKTYILLNNELQPQYYYIKVNKEYIEYGDYEFKNSFFDS